MDDRPPSRMIVSCTCGARMWITPAHLGMTGTCFRCGSTLRLVLENVSPAREPASLSPEKARRYRGTLLKQAAGLISRGEFEAASRLLLEVVAHEDTDTDTLAEAWYRLAYCRLKTNRYAEAKAALAQAETRGHADPAGLASRLAVCLEWEAGPNVLLSEPAYRQTRTRVEARQYRAHVLATSPEALLKQGEPAAASEAYYIRKASPPGARTATPAIVSADNDMDRASQLLALRSFSEALPLLKSAVQGYGLAGEGCAWDHADAQWNLGYALARLGLAHEGLAHLEHASALLAHQGRIKAWVRCHITLLTHRKEPSLLSEPAELRLLVQACQQLNLRSELLWIHLLIVRDLLETGRLRQAQRVWAVIRSLVKPAGGAAADEFARMRLKLTPEACLRAAVRRVTGKAVTDVAGARRALVDFSRGSLSPARCIEALRAVHLVEMLEPEDHETRETAASLCTELAIAAYAAGDRCAGAAWWRIAFGRDRDSLHRVCSLAKRTVHRRRRQGLMRLLDDHVRAAPSHAAQAALAGLLVLHALEALSLDRDDTAAASLHVAVGLGLHQDQLRQQLAVIGLTGEQWARLLPAAGTAWTSALLSAVEKSVGPEEASAGDHEPGRAPSLGEAGP